MMNDSLLQRMKVAGALTRDGKLSEATRVIQSAMSQTDRNAGPSTPAPVLSAVRNTLTDTEFVAGRHSHLQESLHYKLFMPSAMRNEPVPLLLMLHGCTQDADDFATGTSMNSVAEANGVAVLYPSQATSSNVNACWNWFEPAHQRRGTGEPARLSALTQQICAEYAIDDTRVFVAGLSAGGAMAVILGEQYPDLFCAVGVHSGLPTGMASSMAEALSAMKGSGTASRASRHNRRSASLHASWPQSAPNTFTQPTTVDRTVIDGQVVAPMRPHIVFHGAQDRTVHISNAEAIVENCLRRVPERSTVSATTRHHESAKRRKVTVTTYSSTSQEVICEHWHLRTAGHRWSGGNPAGSHTDATGPDASAEMIRFFLACRPYSKA